MMEDTGDRVVRTPEELAHDQYLNDSTPQVQEDLPSSTTMGRPSNMISTKTNTDTSMTNMAMGMIKGTADSMMT